MLKINSQNEGEDGKESTVEGNEEVWDAKLAFGALDNSFLASDYGQSIKNFAYGIRGKGLLQLDNETGKIVTEWKFGKDGTDIAFGILQMIVRELSWSCICRFSRWTNFQCFTTTGDDSIVVGFLNGKNPLYSTNSTRQAKTAFPGLGSPITHR
ncbi:hypothetical protein V6N13_049202 [Hibiscus sabdariffa]